MKTIISIYFKVLSRISPRLAGKQAFNLFQRPFNKKIRSSDKKLYQFSHAFQVKNEKEKIQCYTMGPLNGPVIFMLHGWESNAGSFSNIVFKLAEMGNRVILFNLPAHGYSKLNKNNLKLSKDAFLKVINYINPKKPFSIISHSFGSAISAYALSKTNYELDQMIFLTSPNHMTKIFDDYSKYIGLNQKGAENLTRRAEFLLDEPLMDISVEKLSTKINYKNLLLIHDIQDKVIPISDTMGIHYYWNRSELFLIDGSGHYKMLWNEKVLNKILGVFSKEKKKIVDYEMAV